jgi:predicted ATPase
VGKTRLALAVAHAMERSYPGAVCWTELASVGQSADVEETLARALDIPRLPEESASDALRRFLSPRRLLLVIDNFEHLLDASGVVGDLLGACAALKVLVTSREALNLSAEHRVVIEPLALPAAPEQATLAELQATAATGLFLAAARRHDARFAPEPGQAPAVARLCVRLDGLPLALELAAARVELLGIDELAVELDAALSGSRRTARDLADRHQTLDATIEWSRALLNDIEQAAFAAFAVFAGGATLAAAEEVTAAPRDVLHALIAKSVIRRRPQPDGSTRLVMLETVRQYASARLEERPEREAIRRRHFDVYERLAASAAARLNTHDETSALSVLDAEVDNLSAALRWAIRRAPASAVRLACHLGGYWVIRADASGLGYLDAVLTAGDGGDAADRGRVLLFRARLRGARHEHVLAREDTNDAVALLEEIGDVAGLAAAYLYLAFLAASLGDADDAVQRLGEIAIQHAERAGEDRLIAMALARLATVIPHGAREENLERARVMLARIGSDREIAQVYINAAYTSLREDHPAESMAYSEIARVAAERLGDVAQTMFVMGNIGIAHLFLGDPEAAGAAFRRQLELCLGQAFEFGADEGLIGLGAVAAAGGHPQRAATLLGASTALGYPLPLDQPVYDRLDRDYFTPARTACGAARWQPAQQAGAALSYEAAIRAALEPPAVEAPSVQHPLDGASTEILGVTDDSGASPGARR